MFGLSSPKPPKPPERPTITIQAMSHAAAEDKFCVVSPQTLCQGEACMGWVRLTDTGAGNCTHVLQALAVLAEVTKSKVASG